ncbi:nickel ABC transporter, nickel/metallophore periplasmic binding protein [Sporosarcina sp. P13]|uniref:nickel ABC transporter substrate-binding protein n=1 Tax=Sporosarcina sp. P13 TaxID=2048263 RepID=UPI000C1703FA|nr:nickel ABC transporter substrate-binding protein [Sporosarcina sp. P13]PIC63462.1 nickel ABC transporter, nickel/metallophore periplasmic binding protein [Sporosarcina sp. P13]
MKKRNIWAVSLIVLTIILALAGCSQQDENKIAATKDDKKVFTFSWSGDIGDLNPHTYFPNEFFSQAMVYESLVYYGEDGEIKPWLAKSWDVLEDGKEYIFHLRDDVKFSDGSAFNAAIVKKNFDAVLANREQHDWIDLINQIKTTEVIDNYTFKLTLHHAYYPTLQELTYVRPLRFVAESAFPASGDTFTDGLTAPIGTGPWVLKEHKENEYAIFESNDTYWGEKPKVDEVVVKVITDGESRVLAFEKGELDMIFGNGVISQDSFKFLKESGKYETKISEPTATRTLLFNTNRETMSDKNIRLALQHAFDKDAVIDNIFYGIERKADTLFPQNLTYTNVEVDPYAYDVEKATALLDEAGWKTVKGKEFREKDGQPLQLELLFISTDNIQKSIAEFVQGDLRKIGVDVKLTSQESNTFWTTAFDGHYDILFTATWANPFDPHSYLASITTDSSGGGPDYYALSGLSFKKELDTRIKEVLLTTTEEDRIKQYHQILTMLHEEAVYLPISYQSNIAVYKKNILGVDFLPQEVEIPTTTIDMKN